MLTELSQVIEAGPGEGGQQRLGLLIGSLIVWVGILIGTAVILSGTPYFAQILLILLAGPLWFVIVVPGAFFWSHPKSDQSLPKKEAGQTPVS